MKGKDGSWRENLGCPSMKEACGVLQTPALLLGYGTNDERLLNGLQCEKD